MSTFFEDKPDQNSLCFRTYKYAYNPTLALF